MLLAALVVGLFAAWVWGPRVGLTAAGVALGLFVAAWILPSLAVWIYLGVGLSSAGLAAYAVRKPRHPVTGKAFELGRMLVAKLRKR